MSTKKKCEGKEREKVYCMNCEKLVQGAYCIHPEVTLKDPIDPKTVQWARDINENNDCPHFTPKLRPKVYCGECANYRAPYRTEYLEGAISGAQQWPISRQVPAGCAAPENKKDTYMLPKSELSRKPSEINANNDCPWFKKMISVEVTVGDKLKELQKALSGFGSGGIYHPTIKPKKRPWWRFWQRNGA